MKIIITKIKTIPKYTSTMELTFLQKKPDKKNMFFPKYRLNMFNQITLKLWHISSYKQHKKRSSNWRKFFWYKNFPTHRRLSRRGGPGLPFSENYGKRLGMLGRLGKKNESVGRKTSQNEKFTWVSLLLENAVWKDIFWKMPSELSSPNSPQGIKANRLLLRRYLNLNWFDSVVFSLF